MMACLLHSLAMLPFIRMPGSGFASDMLASIIGLRCSLEDVVGIATDDVIVVSGGD